MGRLTEAIAPTGTDNQYSYITPPGRTAPGAAIIKDKPAKTYTSQQIASHCDKIENLCLTAHPDGKLMFESIQIIRQLQAENAELGIIVSAFQEAGPEQLLSK